MERRLAAILAADVVGYSRLMGQDEEGTLARLEGLKAEILDPLIAQHRGRVVKLMGDGFLVEFASVVDALICALDWQDAVEVRASQVPEDRALRFRIGVNLGDVMVKGDDIYGDGVNVAARLEGMAEPGSVLVSRTVFTHAKGKVPATFEDLGEQELKNIAEPVQVFRVSKGSEDMEIPAVAKVTSRLRRLPVIAATVVLLIVAAGVALWQRPWEPREEPASLEAMAFPLPDKPSIAVLPFTNLSDDPSQDYFADGMTEDLITDLSKISGLFVIARNSSFSYKGQQVRVRQVAEELGVRYVLEGSVRRVGDQVRINAQLIDATTGGHLWADRFDRDLGDIFKLQDEVIGNIVSALAVELTDKEKAGRKTREQAGNLQAHEYFLRGKQHLGRFTTKDTANAKEWFEKAIELDPKHAQALTALGRLHYNEWEIWGKARDKNLARALELGQDAVAVDDTLAGPHLLLGQVYRFLRQKEKSEIETNKALALEPRDADTLAGLGDVLRWSGRAKEAIRLVQTAMRLDPFYPAWYEFYLGDALFETGRYEEAIVALKRGAERNPNYPPFPLTIAASHAMLGRDEEARSAVAEVLRINPRFTLKAFVAHVPFNSNAVRDHHLTAFRKAGLPE
ncbi:MAG: adenylate/guanylate cyclase domain-containing protein [Proteobacteria bacterium]|nr:adenylate/guanylate cyclase domain-containing protein [Pseudomonadota bacterium]